MRPTPAQRDLRLAMAHEVREHGYQGVDAVTEELAEALLEIAETNMPSSFFQSDSRCELARAVMEKRSA